MRSFATILLVNETSINLYQEKLRKQVPEHIARSITNLLVQIENIACHHF